LFSVQENSERISAHCEEGGWAAIIEKGYFTICKGEWRIRIAKVKEVPLTLDGRAACMIENVLPAILAASIRGFEGKTIRKALQSFVPGPQLTPGRMNIFQFRNYTLMVDYAHNTDGFIKLRKFMQQVDARVKIGIIGCPGDRRDEDLVNMGYHAAQMFDEIIIKHDKDPRGRNNDDITKLIMQGIHKHAPGMDVTVISDEIESIQHVMEHAPKGAFIVICCDEVRRIIDFVTSVHEKEDLKWHQKAHY
jgi:cyanophycin synthetase